ncbi:unnamed protein product [Rotaria sp. Silwood1]|nr:unnamed protein product [Rotaria sp. Silwood1]CAF4693295.1 unnamed protein product [Rotaria sp. Silwood1]
MLRNFQQWHGLKPTGFLDAATKDEMSRPRCGLADIDQTRSGEYKWSHSSLTWSLRSYPQQIQKAQATTIVHDAFNAWVTNIPLQVKEACSISVHEIGHVLSIHHNNDRNSIMFPTYQNLPRNSILPESDRKSIQTLYGALNGGDGGGSKPTCNCPPRQCCSKWGHCGTSNEHCGEGCLQNCGPKSGDGSEEVQKTNNIMKRGFIVTIIWEIISVTAFVLNLTANSSDRWWVKAREGGEHTFVRAGLWQVCFNMYRHRFDYYGKIYHGCWWLFSPEIRLLRSWISTNWLRWVQALSTLSLITSLFAVIAALLILRNREEFKSSKQVLTAAILHALAGILMLATVILFGIAGRRRDWMMNWQFNWFGWSFHLAVISCIFHLATAFMAGYQGSNKYLHDMYDYERAHEELEYRSTLKIPMYQNRPSSERALSSNGGSNTHLHQYA